MKKTLVLTLILLPSVALSQSELNESLNKLWGAGRTESRLKSALMYVPRFLGHTAKDITTSRTSHRVLKTVTGTVKLPFNPERAGYELSDSLINVPAVVHDVGSDVIGLAKNVVGAAYPAAKRIKLCTSNLINNVTHSLTPFQFINPMFHIGAVIDGSNYETTDALAYPDELRSQEYKGGLVCHDVAIKSYEPENIAIERLMCTDSEFHQDYHFLKYNCGGYTKDVLAMAGLGYPQGVNWGIGSDFKSVSNTEEYKTKKQSVIEKCDHHIEQVRKLIVGLENQEDVQEQIQYFSNRSHSISMALFFQILISSERSNNFQAISIAKKFTDVTGLKKEVLNKKGLIKRKYKRLFKLLTIGLEKGSFRSTFSEKFPEAYEIINLALEIQ